MLKVSVPLVGSMSTYDSESITVHIGVVAQNTGSHHRQRCILVHTVRIDAGHRCIVHWIDRDRDRRHVAVDHSVIHVEREAVRAVVIEVWRVSQIGSGPCERAVGRVADEVSQRVEVNIAGRQADSDRYILIRGDRVVIGYWRVVHRIDGQGDGGLGRAALAVTQFVHKTVRTVVVGHGRVGERTVRVERERAVCWFAADDDD